MPKYSHNVTDMTSKTSGCDTRPRTSHYSWDQGFSGVSHSTQLVYPVAGNRPILPPRVLAPKRFALLVLTAFGRVPKNTSLAPMHLCFQLAPTMDFFPTAEPSCSLGTGPLVQLVLRVPRYRQVPYLSTR